MKDNNKDNDDDDDDNNNNVDDNDDDNNIKCTGVDAERQQRQVEVTILAK
jgi:hypothetical protein